MGSPRTTWRIFSPQAPTLLPFSCVLTAPFVRGCGTSAQGGRLEGKLGPPETLIFSCSNVVRTTCGYLVDIAAIPSLGTSLCHPVQAYH